MVTLCRLGVSQALVVSFRATNLIESVMARLEARAERVDRWRTSDQGVRGCASALRRVERQFRRIMHHKQLPLLFGALRVKMMTTTDAAAWPASGVASPDFQLNAGHIQPLHATPSAACNTKKPVGMS